MTVRVPPWTFRARERFGRAARRWKGPLRIVWMTTVVAAIILYAKDNWDAMAALWDSLGPSQVLAIAATTGAGKIVMSEQCRLSTSALGHEFQRRHMFWMYSASDIAKFVPGGIWNAVARVGMYCTKGMKSADAGRAFALEKFWQVSGAFFFNVAFVVDNDLSDRVHGLALPLERSPMLTVEFMVPRLLVPAFGSHQRARIVGRGLPAHPFDPLVTPVALHGSPNISMT